MTMRASLIVPSLRLLARSAPSATALLAVAGVEPPSPSAIETQMPSAFSITSNQSPATS